MSTDKRIVWKTVCKVIGVLAGVLGLAMAAAGLYMQYRDYQDKHAPRPASSPPPTAEDLYLTGSDLQHQGRYREAIKVFTEAANQVRTDTAAGQHQAALIHFSLGQCYLQPLADCKEASRYLGLLTADGSGLYDLLKAEYDNAPCK